MRRDARQRREALLKAAAACFREAGYQVPLEEIARRAGVGRGTLYRNFKDRLDLTLAIFSATMDDAEQVIASTADVRTMLARLVVEAAPLAALYNRLVLDLAQDERSNAGFEEIGRRTTLLLQPIVDKGRASGLLRDDLVVADIEMLFRMAGGLILPSYSDDEARIVSEQALALMMDGLRPR